VEAEETVPGGASGAALLASRGATAIVCSSDSLALGAAEKLRELLPGTARPAVVGFDNTPVAAALGLSSVAQPVEEAARHMIRVLTYELAGDGTGAASNPPAAPPEKQLLLAPHVVERVPLPLAATGSRPA
jgi:DNA-binding LacI/PurR family transcriptional regulator